MTVRSIVKLGNPTLREGSEDIQSGDFGSEWLLELVQDLWDSMRHYGGVGIAAPQIGVNRRVFVFGFESTERYKEVEPVSYTVLCNPRITILDPDLQSYPEGCLSLGDLRAEIPRAKKIEYSGFDENGKEIKRIASDFHARIVLHETDHLDGIVMLDRVVNNRTIVFQEEIKKLLEKNEVVSSI